MPETLEIKITLQEEDAGKKIRLQTSDVASGEDLIFAMRYLALVLLKSAPDDTSVHITKLRLYEAFAGLPNFKADLEALFSGN